MVKLVLELRSCCNGLNIRFIQVLLGIINQYGTFYCIHRFAHCSSGYIVVLMNKVQVKCKKQEVECKEIKYPGDTFFHKIWI